MVWIGWAGAVQLFFTICNKSSNKIKLYSLPMPVLLSVDVESIESLTCEKLLWILDCSSVEINHFGACEHCGVNLGSSH